MNQNRYLEILNKYKEYPMWANMEVRDDIVDMIKGYEELRAKLDEAMNKAEHLQSDLAIAIKALETYEKNYHGAVGYNAREALKKIAKGTDLR